MADFTYRGTLGGVSPESKEFRVASGTTASIVPGKIVTVSDGTATLVADGGAATTGRYGLTLSTSTETLTADGIVLVIFCPAGLLVQGKATTPANLATALMEDRVTLDVALGVQTLDENDPNGVLTLYPPFDATTGLVQASLPWLV